MAQIARTGAARAPNSNENMTDNAAAVRKVATERTAGAVRETAAWAEASVKASTPSLVAAVDQKAADGTAKARQTFITLASEQTKDNLETTRALAGAFDWGRVVQIQAEYARASLERSAQLTQRYLEISRSMMASAGSFSQRQARKSV